MEMLMLAFLTLNIIGFVVMGYDKRRAKKNEYRVSENTLWLIAIMGGAIGATVGMEIFRHKTKHTAFKWGFPLLALVEFMLVVYVLLGGLEWI